MKTSLEKRTANKRYRDANKEKLLEAQRKYRKENRQIVNKRSSDYRKKPEIRAKIAASDKRRREMNLEKSREKERAYNRKQFYGITDAKFLEMLKIQNNCCDICKNPETAIFKKTGKLKSLAVDHCHKTGKIRGLLCAKCNLGIGYFQDNIDFLGKAMDYLIRYREA